MPLFELNLEVVLDLVLVSRPVASCELCVRWIYVV